MIYIDTHIAAWLYQNDLSKISDKARAYLEQEDILISPMAILELQYLYEISRIRHPADKIINQLQRTINLQPCDLPFSTIIREAVLINWTRDPFDRLITAQAVCRNSFLITTDRIIQEKYHKAIG